MYNRKMKEFFVSFQILIFFFFFQMKEKTKSKDLKKVHDVLDII